MAMERQSEKIPSWIRQVGQNITFSCHVCPRAKQNKLLGTYGSALKIALHAPPVDGKANEALCSFLAEVLATPRNAITILNGSTSRAKVLAVRGLSIANAITRIQCALSLASN